MNAESKVQDPEIAQNTSFASNQFERPQSETDDQQKKEHFSDQFSEKNVTDNETDLHLFPKKNSNNPAARNKRKNFNPRPTTFEQIDGDNLNAMNATSISSSIDSLESKRMLSSSNRDTICGSSKSPVLPSMPSQPNRGCFPESSGKLSSSGAIAGSGQSTTQFPPWMQMFSQYEQLVKAAGLSAGGCREFGAAATNAPDLTEFVKKLESSDLAATTIRDIIKAYQGKARKDSLHQDGNGKVNLSTETEPPTPPTTPQTCHSSSRSIFVNGNIEHPAPPPISTYQSPQHWNSVKSEGEEKVNNNSSSPTPITSENQNYRKNQQISEENSQLTSTAMEIHWNSNSDQKLSKRDSTDEDDDEYPRKTTQAKSCQAHDDDDDSSECGDHQHDHRQQNSGNAERPQSEPQQGHLNNMRDWCEDEDFQKIDKRIKSECDDTETTDECENNLYDEEDYPPPSPNDFPDSANEEEDDDVDEDDNYSMFCDDEHSEADDPHHCMRINFNSEDRDGRTSTDNINADESPSLVAAEKESTCSNSSSRISVRNLGGFYDQGQMNSYQSKRGGIDEKTMHPDFVQNMNKFTSYLECLNEICRLENLREHYHCHDYPCFGKILSKKEEVIRHVKWHRKRMESLNHGFMRFSSSDDCSTTFGKNCQHNRKQTHYHCFQPNCDRVYISTSDVQMHSNFHRKDSAIYKEGFQRFRANEKCSADYCMFAGQKTTHFHCRRDNCRYTFKNKADMEKHKTYHIKDLKLARDGFKKFLKNEACPYKQCRFSKVCNHIHCARENCFYVLHSSGQLLSHKRKHERLDNEQTYCRYKMLAVKAALLGNPGAPSTISPEMPPFNFSNPLMQFRDLEMNAFNPSRSTTSEPSSLPSPKQEPSFPNKDDGSSSSAFSMEFIQQMKKRHEELLNQKQHHQIDELPLPSDRTGCPEVSVFPVIKRSNSPQHQYNMALDHTHLTPSIIQQFFTTECPSGQQQCQLEKTEPLDVKSLNEEVSQNRRECPWKDHLEPHLHCVLKECETVIPNNVLDISAHIRMHGYNRDVYATTAASESLFIGSSSTGNSSNPMQITTIDGFFNRKRGRPPKNRFVEVYKNAQQSPQAIFTSFKLEKQATTSKECTATMCDVGPPASAPYDPSTKQQLSIDTISSTQHHMEESSLLNHTSPSIQQQQSDFAYSPRTTSEFVTYNVNENCGVAGARCPLTMQHHYHCACTSDCTFVTVERDLLSVHLERQHTATSFADTISKKFKRFDRNIGLDCGIFECRLRKTRPHLHCRQCYRQISPFDLESHICGEPEQRLLSSSPTKKMSSVSSSTFSPEFLRNEQQQQTHLLEECPGGRNFIRDFSRLPSVTFSTLNELRRKVSEMEPESIGSSKRTHEDEKVLVVRAAGTYFPENSSELSNIPSPAQQRQPSTAENVPQAPPPVLPVNSAYCTTPYCKHKRRPHDHCESCDQSFVDPVKWRAHRLKHLQATNQPIPFHLSHFKEREDSKPKNCLNATSVNENNHRQDHNEIGYDEQPQDLSLSPQTQNTPTSAADERMKLNREFFPGSPRTTPTLSPPKLTAATGHCPNLFPQDLMSSLSIQNFHLAQLATLYQQNPYYYQHLYPFLSNTAALNRHQQQHRNMPTAQPYRISGINDDKPFLSTPLATDGLKSHPPSVVPTLHPAARSSKHFPFLNPLLMVRPSMEHAAKSSQPISSVSAGGLGGQMPSPRSAAMPWEASKSLKRKLTNGNEEFSALIDALSPSTKKQMQFAAGLAAVAAAAAASNDTSCTTASTSQPGGGSSGSVSSRSTTHHEQHGQHFKIKDEQIPNGYLKFRFNEDCFFPKCGYRNHQSHFHCDRNDCHYSFCDKTRFVQHTARHERLDKLMGNDFRQFRANMSCGYENCPYYKNLGSSNKSSHFHCLKCDFICSDTNKVVAHRRQHSKMEYIRMAGFRKVTNSEKCNSTFEATVPTNGNEIPGTVECSYSQKQTHYHCLVCDVSVLSRAQLSSHKHKT